MSMFDRGMPSIDFGNMNIDLSGVDLAGLDLSQFAIPEDTTPVTPTPSTTAPSTTEATSNRSQNAKEILRRGLKNYGLDALTDSVWMMVKDETILNPNDPDEIGRAVADTPEYAARFPGNIALRNAGKPERSVTEYIQLEQAYASTLQGNGLPSGFYDSADDFSKFIVGNVSPAQLQERIDAGYNAVANSNPQVVAQMKELYGVDEGGLVSYFIDPVRATPIIRRQARAAQIAAEASRQAGIQLGVGTAEALAREDISPELAQRGFAQIAAEQGLAAPLMAGEEALTTEEQIGATFGTSAAARQRVETRRRRRQAAFEGGGGFAGMGKGEATGLTTVGQ